MRGHLVESVLKLDNALALISELEISDEACKMLSETVFGAKFSVQSALKSVNQMYSELVNVSGRKI